MKAKQIRRVVAGYLCQICWWKLQVHLCFKTVFIAVSSTEEFPKIIVHPRTDSYARKRLQAEQQRST
jgi:hypothetical protein